MQAVHPDAQPISAAEHLAAWAAPAPPVTLCATRRLQQQLLQRFGETQFAAGHAVWTQPPCHTQDDWLAECYESAARSAAADGRLLPRPLGRAETDAAWRRIVERDLSERPLLDAGQAARAAGRAWALCCEHRITLPLHAEGDSDAAAFDRWSTSFQMQLDTLGAEAPERLPERLIEALDADWWEAPTRLVLAGFDRLSPALRHLLDRLVAAGCTLLWLMPPRHDSQRHALPAVDRDAELRLAAQTVLRLAEAEPEARIGVVVTDLAARLDTVQRVFDAALCPQRHPEDDPEARPWNLSLGAALAEQPLVADGLLWLDWLAHGGSPRPLEDVLRLLRSPFGPGASHGKAVAACERHWRKRRFEQLGLRSAAAQLAHCGADTLAQRLQEPSLDDGPALPSAWSSAFAHALNAVGWPDSDTLESGAFQALQAWNETLAQLGGLDAVLGRVRATTAVAHLREMLTNRAFQPRGGSVRIHVMGALEAGGLSFDHLLALGMDETLWPPAAEPNPFIPVATQRAAGIATASAEGQLDAARRISDRLLASAPDLHLIWAQRVDEQPVALSPLLGAPATRALAADPADARWAATSANASLEAWEDVALPIAMVSDTLPGGMNRLADQAECPFRSAAHFGLSARAPDMPEAAPDAMERGQLLHAVLATLWRELRDQAGLLALSADQRSAAIARATEQALAQRSEDAPHRFTAGVCAVERERLPRLIERLLAIDAARPAFAVEMIEGATPDTEPGRGVPPTVTLGGLSLHAIPDRVDALTDGRRLVIDYKTGTDNRLLGDRLRAPQLPAYAELVEDCVGVAFARLRAGETGYDGFIDADTADALPGARNVAKLRPAQRERFDIADWPDLRAHWRSQLDTLAEEILHGTATVSPADKKSCAYCDLHGLCRIGDTPGTGDGDAS